MVIHYKLKRKSQIIEKEAADGRLPEKGKTIKIYFCRNKILRETYNLRNKGFYFQRQKMLFPIFSLPICSLPFFIQYLSTYCTYRNLLHLSSYCAYLSIVPIQPIYLLYLSSYCAHLPIVPIYVLNLSTYCTYLPIVPIYLLYLSTYCTILHIVPIFLFTYCAYLPTRCKSVVLINML